jgi:ABC-type polysaccharide/polyol phosphate transport system ATPase subunit
MTILEVKNVKKQFRIPSVQRETVREKIFGLFRPPSYETLDVLNGISFSVEQGESIGIMGRNGSGKSTLLKVLAGIYTPDSGAVVKKAPLTPILELGLGWNLELNARDNVMLTATAMGMSLKEVNESLTEILAFSELERFANLELKHYSSGMAARLAYAIAFRAAREILLLDEIFAVGDVGFSERCEEEYRQLHKKGHTLILVSHAPSQIRDFCQRAILIEGGRVVMNDEPAKVAQAYLDLLGAQDPDLPKSLE